MKIKLPIILASIVFLTSAELTQAQVMQKAANTVYNASFQGAMERQEKKAEAIKAELNEKIERERLEFREKIQTRTQEFEQQRAQVRAQVTAQHAERLERRFGLYYEKLSQVIDKLEARIDQMDLDDDAKDEALEKLDTARETLELAKSEADLSVSQFNSIEADDYQSQRPVALAARDDAEQARVKFMAVHQLIAEVIRTLKLSS